MAVKMSPETEKLVKQFQKDKKLGSLDEAISGVLAIGATRYLTITNYAKKREQVAKFEAGEIKTAPTFQARKNLFPKLVVKGEKEPPTPAAKKKPGKATKEEKKEAAALLE